MHEQIIGKSQAIRHVRELIDRVSKTGLNVVITGESGVGKELVAQHLYLNSPRNGKPFIKVNCAALPDTLLESELFGYVPGAFTGANRKKRGKFEVADGGVLFLDEIGDMSLPLQSKLLHVLESEEFCPLQNLKNRPHPFRSPPGLPRR
ncbi:MAG TPA: sigma-54 factor interaction domain-containing protein [Desulfobacterales bacterium]|nr:sigma-54 factor interaction domain-containing protein [Desulfobacterales bacterium]